MAPCSSTIRFWSSAMKGVFPGGCSTWSQARLPGTAGLVSLGGWDSQTVRETTSAPG